ncbi:MAG: sugar ABC transporter [Alphaproteobacteria bacterium]|nr:sugar ABC transporter [Alphaproteobacteria bacterium]
MIYTVECAFTVPEREDDWNAYYDDEKLNALLSVPGFRASQRFRAIMETRAPYLAVHSLRDESVMDSRYRGVGGGAFGGWDDLVTNWDRNLFHGLAVAPEVPANACLVILDDPAREAELDGVTFDWLDIAGLDRTVERRGLAVVDRATGEALAANKADLVRVFEPITERRISPHGLEA